VLVVEDEYLLAHDMRTELHNAGAIVVGPLGTFAKTVALIETGEHLDGAVLDANLGGEMVFPAADLLIERGVPFVFTTGYDASVIPSRFSAVPRCEKPVDARAILRAIERALTTTPSPQWRA
jgi:FixJ family two-component response regulator